MIGFFPCKYRMFLSVLMGYSEELLLVFKLNVKNNFESHVSSTKALNQC
jgi:hypothetical protein